MLNTCCFGSKTFVRATLESKGKHLGKKKMKKPGLLNLRGIMRLEFRHEIPQAGGQVGTMQGLCETGMYAYQLSMAGTSRFTLLI